jgi:hypothetical protein
VTARALRKASIYKAGQSEIWRADKNVRQAERQKRYHEKQRMEECTKQVNMISYCTMHIFSKRNEKLLRRGQETADKQKEKSACKNYIIRRFYLSLFFLETCTPVKRTS